MTIELTPTNIRNTIALGLLFGFAVIMANTAFFAVRDVFREPYVPCRTTEPAQ